MHRLNNHMEETEIKLRDAHANIIVLEAENKRLTDELKTVNDSGGVLPTRPSSSPRTDGAEGVDDVNDIVSPVSDEVVMVNAGNPVVSTVLHKNQHPFHLKLNARQKHERNVQVTQASSMIAAHGAAIGISPDKAAALASIAGEQLAKSFSQAVGSAPDKAIDSNRFPPLAPSNAWHPANKNKGKRRLNRYQLGSKPTDIGLAAPKPEWCDYKTLVIAGLDKRLLSQKEVICEKISELAGKTINIHHMEILSKEYNHWLTIAIELSADDYTLLNDQSFWQSGLRIRPFQGRRGWRQKHLTKTDRTNSVHMSWT